MIDTLLYFRAARKCREGSDKRMVTFSTVQIKG